MQKGNALAVLNPVMTVLDDANCQQISFAQNTPTPYIVISLQWS